MAGRSNKMTIRVHPNRTNQNVTFQCTGHFGRLSVGVGPIYMPAQTLVTGPDAKLYWNAVLVAVQAKLLSL
jgi:hypothetical protein